MLSDPAFTTDFLSVRKMGADTATKKRKWEEIDNVLPSQKNAVDYQLNSSGPYGNYTSSAGFLNELDESISFVQRPRSSVSNLGSHIRDSILIQHADIHPETRDHKEYALEDKEILGNRDELTTPVAITALDTSALLANPNYLYEQTSVPPRDLNLSDCYPYDLSSSPAPHLTSAGVAGQFDTDVCSNSYGMDESRMGENLISNGTVESLPQSGGGEILPNNLINPIPTPCQSLLWFDGMASHTNEADDYCRRNDLSDSFPCASLEVTAMGEQYSSAAVGSRRTLSSNKFTCEIHDQQSQQHPKDPSLQQPDPGLLGLRYTDELTPSSNKIPYQSLDVTEPRRDKVTGKFKQNNHSEHSSSLEKRCKVCGDRAVNHNFGQLTCESCKAFFRRNAHKFLPNLLEASTSDEPCFEYDGQTMSSPRARCFVELTCTSKTGEHDITPTTRRECPACRLKKCFLVGMRPDLIQVRKKDGSKPRWLDKVPSAAIVHEKHFQSTDASGWVTAGLAIGKLKSQSNTDRLAKQGNKENREDVCSTDSGSCVSVDNSALHPDSTTHFGGGKRQKLVTADNIDLFEHPFNGVGVRNHPTDGEVRTTVTEGLNFHPVSVTDATDSLFNSQTPNRTAGGNLSTANNTLSMINLLSTSSAAAVMNEYSHPLMFNASSTALLQIGASQPTSLPIKYEVSSTSEQHLPPSCQLTTTLNQSQPQNSLESTNNLEDYILLAETPRLFVPTNVVAIGTAPATVHQIANSNPNSSVQQVGLELGLNHLEVVQPPISSQLQYGNYGKTPPADQTLQPLSPGNVLIHTPATGITSPILKSTWSPIANTLSNGIVQVRTVGAESITQSIASTLSRCLFATPVQPLTCVAHTSMQLECPNIPVSTVSSFQLPLQNASCSTGDETAVTAITAQSNANHMMNQLNGSSAESALLLPDAPEAQFTSGSSQTINRSSCAATNPNNLSWQGVPTSSTETFLKSENVPKTIQDNGAFTEARWNVAPSVLTETANPRTKEIALRSVANAVRPKSDLSSCPVFSSSRTPCSLDEVNQAWKVMWHGGEFPNPEMLDVQNAAKFSSHLLTWRLGLANLWSDVLLRRVAVFAISLLSPICCIPDDQEHFHQSCQRLYQSRFKVEENEVLRSEISVDSPEKTDHLYLTWEDMIWLAQHRFIQCVPVLLINCLANMKGNRSSSSTVPNSKFMPSSPSLPPPSKSIDKDCELSELNKVKFPNQVNRFDSLDSTDRGKPSSTQAEQQQVNQRNVMDEQKMDQSAEARITDETVVHFRCEPGGEVHLSLTKMSSILGTITTGSGNQKTAYPILQYLDAYIAQFGSFLAYKPVLLGTFMALKLTDPVSLGQPSVTGCDEDRLRRMANLHWHFVQVFSEAADCVAMNASRRQSNDGKPVDQPNSKEIAAANSRRAMLQDFMTWSRQFDAAWQNFQVDTAQLARQAVAKSLRGFQIAQGFKALFGGSAADESSQRDMLVQLLTDAIAELSCGEQKQHNRE
ncbi:unnamed protein product [Calicophoron daubneyi]|uniref:Nuclear receptor domain-containing protein n=1 Tax=Calicophoron daubneyi TaxID=300641 RepID=A0AAV2TXV8_CALDB